MGDITKNFSRSEFACRGDNCCDNSAPISKYFVRSLQALRNLIGKEVGYDVPLTISSGFRCRKHNKNIGGAEHSRHTMGDAADVMCPEELTVDEFYSLAIQIDGFRKGGIGKYSNRLHLDTRGVVARWDNR